ncbi:MAG: anti-sigma factor [Saprospiraceae bacterium]
MDIEAYIASGILEQYVLNDLSEEERKRVERYAKQYPEIKNEITTIEDSLEAYAKLNAIAPPPGLGTILLSMIEDEQIPEAVPTALGMEEQLTFILRADTLIIHLKGTKLAPQALAVIYWNTKLKRAFFKAIQLPKLAPRQQYQLWGFGQEEAINLGILEENAADLRELLFIEAFNSFGITVESEGGSVLPNLAQVYAAGKKKLNR